MKRIFVLVLAGLLALSTGALAAPESKVIGDAHSIDTRYAGPFNVNLEKWFADHPVESGKTLRMETIFQTPRIVVVSLEVPNKGPMLDFHYHTFADELMLLIQGQCEEYIDGKWVLMNPGTMHYNPRGVIHAGRSVGEKPVRALTIFTPAQPDRVFLNTEITTAREGAVVGDWSLLDTQYKRGVNFNLEEWYASHPIQPGQTMRTDPVMGTLRNQLVIAQRPSFPVHYHGSGDEIIYVYKGIAELYINGEWVKVYPGEVHLNPRGYIHGIRPADDGELKTFAVSAPPQANGNDRIFLDLK